MATPDWTNEAACRDSDPELFFPIGTTGASVRQITMAKKVCRGCPARVDCLSYALNHGISDGIWGGTTQDERRTLPRSVVA